MRRCRQNKFKRKYRLIQNSSVLESQTLQILRTNVCEKCPSSIWCWDSNPRPLEHESPRITIMQTRAHVQDINFLIAVASSFALLDPSSISLFGQKNPFLLLRIKTPG